MTQRKTGEGGDAPRNPREQKLAQALRENLRRRKAAAQPAPAAKPPGSDAD
jgi:uncharacterized lipoprotein YmbA